MVCKGFLVCLLFFSSTGVNKQDSPSGLLRKRLHLSGKNIDISVSTGELFFVVHLKRSRNHVTPSKSNNIRPRSQVRRFLTKSIATALAHRRREVFACLDKQKLGYYFACTRLPAFLCWSAHSVFFFDAGWPDSVWLLS